jgi:hypothetical protein
MADAVKIHFKRSLEGTLCIGEFTGIPRAWQPFIELDMQVEEDVWHGVTLGVDLAKETLALRMRELEPESAEITKKAITEALHRCYKEFLAAVQQWLEQGEEDIEISPPEKVQVAA